METIANKKALKTAKIIYWICTGILALFLLSGAFFINSKMALDAMHHLGVPEWFRWELSIGHIIGGLLLLLPAEPLWHTKMMHCIKSHFTINKKGAR